jgi:hypothetical protein
MGASAARAAEETERLAALVAAMVLLSDWERDALRAAINGGAERPARARAQRHPTRGRARGPPCARQLAASVARDDLAA